MYCNQTAVAFDPVRRFRGLAGSLFGSKICLILLLIPFYKSSFYDAFGSLSTISNTLLAVEAFAFLFLFLLCGYRSKLLFFLVCYFFWDCFLAPFLGGTTAPGLYYCYQAVGFALLVLLGLKAAGKNFLNNLSLVMCLACIANFILLLLFPNGFTSGINGNLWLFGIRTGFALALVPAMCVCIVRDCVLGRATFSLRTLLTILVTVASIVNQWVATGIVELAMILALYLFVWRTRTLSIKTISAVIAIFGFTLVVFGPSTFMGDWLDLLGRDMTFTGRTDIWKAALMDIASSPVYGLGGVYYVVVNEAVKGFHCLWLSVAHESGIPGLVIYAAMFVYCLYALGENEDKKPTLIIGVFLLGVLVASIVEIQTYFPFMYGLLAFPEFFAGDALVATNATIPVPMKIR